MYKRQINPLEVDQVEAVKAITRGFGVDHSLVAVAGKGIKRKCFDITAGWGQMVVVGHGHPRDEMMTDINYMECLSGKRITGSVMGAVTLRCDIPLYMDMYLSLIHI